MNWANTTARRFALVAACAALAVAGMAAGSTARAQTPIINPSLAHLEIDIWPEFDKASTVLVILRGEIAADVTLPTDVSVRIPTSSGGPIAVAEASSATGQLLELPYQRGDVQVDFMTINFSATNRFIHVEFYDPLKTESPAREYQYLWPGDFSVARVTLQVQEPAGSSEVSVSPELGAPVQQADGLLYRQGDLGALELGKGLTADVGYQRTETRTSVDMLGLGQGAASSSNGSDWTTTRLLILGAMGAVSAVLVLTALVLWWRQRASARAAPLSRVQRRRQGMAGASGPACSKCSGELLPGARFCPSCGHPVKAKH